LTALFSLPNNKPMEQGEEEAVRILPKVLLPERLLLHIQ
jgi:hypothetical protein